MPSFDPQDRARLYHYASDLRIWFQEWLLEPVRKATGGIIPAALSTLHTDMNELENQFGRQLDQPIDIDDRHSPLLKRILLYQRQHLAEKHEEIRLKTTSSEIRDALEAQSEPVRRLMSEEWFQNTRAIRLPRLTDFLTPRDTYQVMPAAPDLRGSDYDDKFRILLSPASFLPALRRCRIESWLRDISVAVAFTDIDDFKALNTRYTESVVDRDLLPKIMRTIEAHVYSHGWAYRFGGDEYLLLLPNMDLKVAGDFLQTLQERLRSLEFQGNHGIQERIAVSIGLCLVTPDSFLTDREVQEKANRAMQHAKQVRKNCIATFRGEFFGDEDLYVMNRPGHQEP